MDIKKKNLKDKLQDLKNLAVEALMCDEDLNPADVLKLVNDIIDYCTNRNRF